MNILISGIGGRMGWMVAEACLAGMRNSVPVAGYDRTVQDVGGIPVYTDWASVHENVDCIIDFSHHSATGALLRFAVSRKIPAVIATTGHTEAEKEEIFQSAKRIPVFFSANLSPGIALLEELTGVVARAFPDADAEIIETHHNRKEDAPSGTALLLAEAIRSARGAGELQCGRTGHGRRKRGEIGIHSVRLGNVTGEHEVRIATDTQTFTLRHEAHSRKIFAEGALMAAAFLIGQEPGLYDMKDLLKKTMRNAFLGEAAPHCNISDKGEHI